MLVREVVVRERVDRLVRVAVRIVVDREPPFLLHRVALVVEILLVDHERAHAVGFEVEAEVELIRWKRFEVQRAVLVGGAVHVAAVIEDEHEVLTRPDVLRSLEHHVLEEVGESRAAAPFVARADVVAHRDRVDRRVMVLGDDDAQAVLEPRVGERDVA